MSVQLAIPELKATLAQLEQQEAQELTVMSVQLVAPELKAMSA